MYANQYILLPSSDLAIGSTGPSRSSAIIEYYLEAIITTLNSCKPFITRLLV